MKKSLFHSSYVPLIPCRPLDYENWTRKEAIDFLSWFKARVPERANYIIDMVAEDTVEPNLAHMEGREKLIRVWRWFLHVAEIESVDRDELCTIDPIAKKLGSPFCSGQRFSDRTEYLMRDIGMLFAQLLLARSEQLSWDVVFKPKTDLFFHHPVLTGFVMAEYSPPFHTVADPIHLVGVQGAKLLNRKKDATETDLWEIFNKWAGWIPR